MAAPLLMRWGGSTRRSLKVARRNWCSAPATQPRLYTRILLYLNQRFHEGETIIRWTSWFQNRTVRQKNYFYGYTESNYGRNVAAAHFILSLKGKFRFAGQKDWFGPNSRGKFSYDFVNFKDSQIEEVDVSGTCITHEGLNNLINQRVLRSLSVRGCAEVDDWFLGRLHIFQDSLEELDISHCPLISVGGLTALKNLRSLRRLDMSSLPRVQNAGLVHILLEEMLPQVHIIGVEYDGHPLPSLTDPVTDTLINRQTDAELQAEGLSLTKDRVPQTQKH